MPGKTFESWSGSAIVLPSEIEARVRWTSSSTTMLPAVRATMSSASRIGTPLAIIVPRVRVKRATATFLMITPKIGSLIAILSVW